jgi:hypothetical protein
VLQRQLHWQVWLQERDSKVQRVYLQLVRRREWDSLGLQEVCQQLGRQPEELKLLSEQGLGYSQVAGEFRLVLPQESIQLMESTEQLKEIRELLLQLNLLVVEQQHLQPV